MNRECGRGAAGSREKFRNSVSRGTKKNMMGRSKDGRKKGRKEGRKDGSKEGRKERSKEGRKEGWKEGFKG